MIDVEKLYVQHILEIEEIKKEHDKLMMAKVTKYENEIAELEKKIKELEKIIEDNRVGQGGWVS